MDNGPLPVQLHGDSLVPWQQYMLFGKKRKRRSLYLRAVSDNETGTPAWVGQSDVSGIQSILKFKPMRILPTTFIH
jgi:hypothetical protein